MFNVVAAMHTLLLLTPAFTLLGMQHSSVSGAVAVALVVRKARAGAHQETATVSLFLVPAQWQGEKMFQGRGNPGHGHGFG